MPGTPALLVAAGAVIVLLLGSLHLFITYRGNKLHARDETLNARMREVSPVISRDTTMWRTWIGFNASHSFGAILFGLLYGWLALRRPDVLFDSRFLRVVGLVTLLGYIVLAVRHWFRTPLTGIALATVLFAAGLAVDIFVPG